MRALPLVQRPWPIPADSGQGPWLVCHTGQPVADYHTCPVCLSWGCHFFLLDQGYSCEFSFLTNYCIYSELCCCSSVAQSRPAVCDPMDYSTPGFPVLHYLREFAQSPVHWVSGVMQHLVLFTPFSSCPQSFPASRSFTTGWLFASGGPSIRTSASVLPMNIQG